MSWHRVTQSFFHWCLYATYGMAMMIILAYHATYMFLLVVQACILYLLLAFSEYGEETFCYVSMKT
jgi:hypothetical protein